MKPAARLIKYAPIVRTWDGWYRRVNHEAKLASTGFATADAMQRNSDILSTDAAALELMRKRYAELYPLLTKESK